MITYDDFTIMKGHHEFSLVQPKAQCYGLTFHLDILPAPKRVKAEYLTLVCPLYSDDTSLCL